MYIVTFEVVTTTITRYKMGTWADPSKDDSVLDRFVDMVGDGTAEELQVGVENVETEVEVVDWVYDPLDDGRS